MHLCNISSTKLLQSLNLKVSNKAMSDITLECQRLTAISIVLSAVVAVVRGLCCFVASSVLVWTELIVEVMTECILYLYSPISRCLLRGSLDQPRPSRTVYDW